jgi:Tfp pilus assembly protein PilV
MVTEKREEAGSPRDRRGFTVVEIIVATIVLTFGVLGMAGTTAYVIRQVTLAQVTSRRAAAIQSAVERLRATPYEDLANGSDSVGPFAVDWSVVSSNRSAEVTVITRGPGLYSDASNPFPMLRDGVVDTFVYKVIRP